MAKTIKKSKLNIKKFKINGVLVFTLVLVAIPLTILGFIVLSSLQQSGVPVTEGRFDTQLDPAISDSMLSEIEDTFEFENVDSISVNLSVATLRILINTNDDVDASTIKSIANEAYDIVDSIAAIDTYFTNHDTTKMYDLEIHVYNYIPDSEVEEEVEGQIYAVLHKTASEETKAIDWSTSIVDEDTYNAIQEALNYTAEESEEDE